MASDFWSGELPPGISRDARSKLENLAEFKLQRELPERSSETSQAGGKRSASFETVSDLMVHQLYRVDRSSQSPSSPSKWLRVET